MFRNAIAALLTLFLISNTARSQSIYYESHPYDFLGGGARAEGMGKAFLGVSDDAMGGTWNPAGLYNNEKVILGLSYGSLSSSGSGRSILLDDTLNFEQSGSLGAISSLNLIAPIRIKGHPFVGSLNYNKNFDVLNEWAYSIFDQVEFAFFTPIGTEYDTLDLEYDSRTSTEGGLYTLNIGFGTRLYQNYSFGASVNVYTGHTLSRYTSNLTVYDFHYNVTQRATLQGDSTIVDTNKFSGVNFTIGGKYNGERLGLGLVIRTPFELKTDREEGIYVITKLNGLTVDNGTDTTFYNDLVYKYQVPLIIGTGIGYRAQENLLLAADIEYRGFSGKKILYRESVTINPGGTNEETYFEIDPGWKNVITVRTGAELLTNPSIGRIPLRAGFAIIPVPQPNIDKFGGSSLAVAYDFSLGSGIHWSQIQLDFAYTYRYFNLEYADFVSEVKSTDRNHHFGFSFTGVF